MSIRLKDITLGYGERILVNDVNADIKQGELTALLGRNGTGKSTLLRALAGLGSTLSGSIELMGHDLTTLSVQQRSKLISFVTPEKIAVANLSCEEVVAFGRTPYTNWKGTITLEDRKIVERAMNLVKMSDFAKKDINRLSDGEYQRIMIARALAQDTPIILLDEPTAFLDMPNRYELCILLQKLAHIEKKTIIFSTHDLDIALSLCDGIALIDSPHIHYKTNHEIINSGHIERLFSSDEIHFDPQTQRVNLKKA